MMTTTAVVIGQKHGLLANEHTPGLARWYVPGQLLMWRMDDRISVAGLITSELVTNAVTHAREDSVALWLACSGLSVRIPVWDADDRLPELVPVGADAEGGRGLVLVDTMAITGDRTGPITARSYSRSSRAGSHEYRFRLHAPIG